MHVLVTGGTGVIGKPAVDALLEREHTVRLFSRHADRDRELWQTGVEAYSGSVGTDGDVSGAADGCDAVLHIAGIIDEVPPETTFENINIEGTRRVVEEARRAGVKRFVYVSCLGADRGSTSYHQAKKAGEEIVQTFPREWLICRPSNVYGPGDQVISLLLKMVRTLPAVPVVSGDDQCFQPVWAADLGEALARAIEWENPTREVLELAGDEQVSMNSLFDMLERLTDRHPMRVPVPEWAAVAGAELADRIGMEVPVQSEQITILIEDNVIPPDRQNALTGVFGITPKPVADALKQLADSLPEKLPSEGVGKLHQQRYWADIKNSRLAADELFALVVSEFSSLLPESLVKVGAEPNTPVSLEEGATLTLEVPLRGHIQVRVEQIRERAITCMTVEGHHLAGVIRFTVQERSGLLRFEVRSYTRAAHLLDRLGMVALGRQLQKATWKSMVEEVVDRSGGEAVNGVETKSQVLNDREAERVERWAEQVVIARKREEYGDSAAQTAIE